MAPDSVPAVPARGGPKKERGALLATLGAVFTAIMGSACCWLPLLLIALGFSAAGVGSFFEQYRPYFLTATFALLGVAWYFTYRTTLRRAWARLRGKPVPVPTVEACCASEVTSAPVPSCCGIEPGSEPEDGCVPRTKTDAVRPARGRFTMRPFNQVMLWMATVLIVLFALFPPWVGLFLGGRGNSSGGVNWDGRQQIVLELWGMTCEGCAATVQQALRNVPGVARVDVNYSKAEAVVTAQPGTTLQAEALLQTVREAGYTARLKKYTQRGGS
ncbi:MAG: cation transporter [Planctomycetes bacterium]|nr:cation transporter [Planctomycetota bacterium]